MSENLDNDNKKAKKLNESVTCDPFTDFDTVDNFTNTSSKIIFTSVVYQHLLDLIRTSNHEKHETGCYFLGREQGDDSKVFLIDSFSPDLSPSDGNHEGGAVDDTPEIQAFIKNALNSNNYKHFFHFHVHIAPLESHYESMSDQDLNLYEYLNTEPWYQYFTRAEIEQMAGYEVEDLLYNMIVQSLFDSEGPLNEAFANDLPQNRKATYYGILASPDRTNNKKQERTIHNNYQLSAVLFDSNSTKKDDSNSTKEDELKSRYFRFPNIFYIGNDNIIYRIGDFQRVFRPELTTKRIITEKPRIQAIGKDPNTGLVIKDTAVGKYIDGQLLFDTDIVESKSHERSSNSVKNIDEDDFDR